MHRNWKIVQRFVHLSCMQLTQFLFPASFMVPQAPSRVIPKHHWVWPQTEQKYIFIPLLSLHGHSEADLNANPTVSWSMAWEVTSPWGLPPGSPSEALVISDTHGLHSLSTPCSIENSLFPTSTIVKVEQQILLYEHRNKIRFAIALFLVFIWDFCLKTKTKT